MYRVLIPVPGTNVLMLRRACDKCVTRTKAEHPEMRARLAKELTGCDLHPKR